MLRRWQSQLDNQFDKGWFKSVQWCDRQDWLRLAGIIGNLATRHEDGNRQDCSTGSAFLMTFATIISVILSFQSCIAHLLLPVLFEPPFCKQAPESCSCCMLKPISLAIVLSGWNANGMVGHCNDISIVSPLHWRIWSWNCLRHWCWILDERRICPH